MTASNLQEAFDNAEPIAAPEPQPLYRDLPRAQEFPLDALGPILKPAAQAIESVVQCPLVCAANSLLAVASLAAQGRANIILPIGQGKPVPLSLYLLTVLDSGERKSTADGLALKPVRDFEQELDSKTAEERQDHATTMAARDAKRKQLTSKHKADPDALKAALDELGPDPLPPVISTIAPSGDQTMEGLFRVYQQGRPAIGMLCDDAATFLGGHSLKAEQKVTTTASLCRIWDGSKLERIRGGDGVVILRDRRLAAHFMVQSGVAAEFLGDERFADQGLHPRFLVAAPEGRAGTRFRDDAVYQQVARAAAEKLEAYNAAILSLLRPEVRWKNNFDRNFGVEMDRLELTPQARELLVEAMNTTERELGPNGELVSVKAFASKLPENAARIAGLLTLLQSPDARVVNERTLANAIEIARFYLSEFLRLNATGSIDPALKQAKSLLDWLQTRGADLVPIATIYQRGPNGIRSAGKARASMAILERHGWVAKIEGGAEIGGKYYKEVWRVIRC
ncbi:YfjI family protein [uncultured Erythrobacter sp.]|uniref:YfjI family protein n=1 Tax=uncultured Erythrobacter sp. TaxID=263913 RepID=UPI002602FE04|nr:YfjI family protein [uncultured Erythrobacter sp.]